MVLKYTVQHWNITFLLFTEEAHLLTLTIFAPSWLSSCSVSILTGLGGGAGEAQRSEAGEHCKKKKKTKFRDNSNLNCTRSR